MSLHELGSPMRPAPRQGAACVELDTAGSVEGVGGTPVTPVVGFDAGVDEAGVEGTVGEAPEVTRDEAEVP
jgi:hypothetical protein